MWLDNPTVDVSPLKALLKSFAGQSTLQHRHSDGEHPSRLAFQLHLIQHESEAI